MSLECQVEQLVIAINRGVQNSAVQEIIRQRDQALKDLRDMTSSKDWYSRRMNNSDERRYKLERSNAALRGVITRMKAKGD